MRFTRCAEDAGWGTFDRPEPESSERSRAERQGIALRSVSQEMATDQAGCPGKELGHGYEQRVQSMLLHIPMLSTDQAGQHLARMPSAGPACWVSAPTGPGRISYANLAPLRGDHPMKEFIAYNAMRVTGACKILLKSSFTGHGCIQMGTPEHRKHDFCTILRFLLRRNINIGLDLGWGEERGTQWVKRG